MERAKTYVGYDDKGNEIASCTANDMSKYIDPEAMKVAVNNLITDVQHEIFHSVNHALLTAKLDARDVISASKIGDAIDQVIEQMKEISSGIEAVFSSTYANAVAIQDEQQRQMNSEARESVRRLNNVTTVSEK